MHPSPDETCAAAALLALSHELGAPSHGLAILGEGNTSARLDGDTFLVKASGSSLGTLGAEDLVRCRFDALLPLLDEGKAHPGDLAVDGALLASRCDPAAKKPSVEAIFHAALLSLEGVDWVAHTHPIAVNAVLCSPRGRELAERRMFPDEVVCCGPAALFLPYADPGLGLARAVRAGVAGFAAEHGGRPPRVILLENHGLIALGPTPGAVRAATLMAVKAAAIFAGAAALGGPTFLTPADVRRLDGRPDEAHRRRALKLDL